MPALKKTDFSPRVTWLGVVHDRDRTLRSEYVEQVQAGFTGFPGESHGGLTRPSCSRVSELHPKGTEIRNVRQLSVVSAEELARIAEGIGVEKMDPAWIGASIVVEGIPDFTHIPPASRLQGPDGVTIVVDMENRPCHLPAPLIDDDAPGRGRGFKHAGSGRRGVTAWVEREGMIRVGDTLTLFVPDQPAWAYFDEVRVAK